MKYFCVFFVIFLFFNLNIIGQSKIVDIELIQQHDSISKQSTDYHNHNNTDLLKYKNNSFIRKYNPINLVFAASMFVYQRVVSPQISADCLYEISCSNFGKQSIYEFGLLKGIFLAADRLTRCNTMVVDEIPAYKYNSKTGLVNDKPQDYKVKNAK
ncbi:MAG: membrane protein insertion efficiency factor YidD [Saprospiraceae bacterium]|nr:membrane protein insertion efficiency factor YidD [Saprospiraceae bacterium]